jgi:hypothetical protein
VVWAFCQHARDLHQAHECLSPRSRTILLARTPRASDSSKRMSFLRALAPRRFRHLGARPGRRHFKIMKITRHKKVDALRIYDRRESGFDGHAGEDFL